MPVFTQLKQLCDASIPWARGGARQPPPRGHPPRCMRPGRTQRFDRRARRAPRGLASLLVPIPTVVSTREGRPPALDTQPLSNLTLTSTQAQHARQPECGDQREREWEGNPAAEGPLAQCPGYRPTCTRGAPQRARRQLRAGRHRAMLLAQLSSGGIARLRTGRAREGTPGVGQLASKPTTRRRARSASARAPGASSVRSAQSADQVDNEIASSLEWTFSRGCMASSLRSACAAS